MQFYNSFGVWMQVAGVGQRLRLLDAAILDPVRRPDAGVAVSRAGPVHAVSCSVDAMPDVCGWGYTNWPRVAVACMMLDIGRNIFCHDRIIICFSLLSVDSCFCCAS